MLNSYEYTNKINVNAVSGTITKNYVKSFFIRFHITSSLAQDVFSHKPKYIKQTNYRGDTWKPIVVLQTMLCGDGQLIAEVMWKDDFNDLFKIESEGE